MSKRAEGEGWRDERQRDKRKRKSVGKLSSFPLPCDSTTLLRFFGA